MIVEKISIQNLRNIEKAEIILLPRINIITGSNGAGKSALLEALYLLARARSFRQGDQRTLIKDGEKKMTLFTTMEDSEKVKHKIGMEREGMIVKARIDGKQINRLSEIARIFPIKLVTPQTHRVLEEGPGNRRRLLNWGVFHVEPEFKTIMGDFKRALLQRNSALRRGGKDIYVWDKEFLKQAEKVSTRQAIFTAHWQQAIHELTSDVPFLKDIEVNYSRGWTKQAELAELLKDREKNDRENGFTSVGPQRADIHFELGGFPIKQRLSRGQQKILIILIQIAQAKLMEAKRCEMPVFLIDDIQSELDEKSIEIICEMVDRNLGQVLMTSIKSKKLMDFAWSLQPRLFHVEQGSFKSASRSI